MWSLIGNLNFIYSVPDSRHHRHKIFMSMVDTTSITTENRHIPRLWLQILRYWIKNSSSSQARSTDKFKIHNMRVTPPLLVRSIQGVFRRYAVRKGSVRSTQKSCYIVRRHQLLLLKCPIFIKKHNKRDIQSQITLNFSRARFTCAFLGHFSIYKLKRWFGEVEN